MLQTPYGDSGKTTFFLRDEADWDRCKDDIVGKQVKIMKRINNRAVAVEAVITRHGTVVGPFMTDLTGYPELTPYEGGWCGNDLFPGARAVNAVLTVNGTARPDLRHGHSRSVAVRSLSRHMRP